MKTRITLKEWWESTLDGYDGRTYKHIFDNRKFIFGSLYDVLSETINYPKLNTFLSSALTGGDGDKTWSYMDELLVTLYGQRKCNTYVDHFRYFVYGNDDEQPFDDYRKHMARELLIKIGIRWEQYLNELDIDYNPIHNYDMTEDEKVNTYLETSDNVDKYTNGFNSSTASPTDKSENTITVDGDWDNNKRQLTRKGNIGVTTSQQMLEAEISLRDRNIVAERLLNDIADILTLSIY